jgi:hypothetical protein
MEDQAKVNNNLSIKDVIKQEYISCVQNVPHFIKKYIWIQHPLRGRIPFALFPFQDKVMNIFANTGNRYIAVNKSRQLGVSTLVAAYALWMMLFHSDKNILVIATKQDTAKNMITKVQFMYENLPKWLRLDTLENNKLSLKLKNGSQIKAISAAGDSGRSEAVSLLIIDEAAFIEDIDEIFPAAQQTLSTGGQCIVVSTPKGVGNWFHKVFTEAELSENGFLPIKLPWYVHPERNQTWRDEQDKILGKKNAAQECDCDFSTSGDTVIDPEILAHYEANCVMDPIERRGISQDLWIWEYVDYSKSYMLIADVARGDDKDYSAFHVIDVVDFKQVAEFKSKLPTRDFAKVITTVATEWNNALVVVENSGIGWDVVMSLVESQYRNLYYSIKNSGDLTPEMYISKYDSGQTVPGFVNSSKTRPLVVSKLKEALTDKTFVFRSKRFLTELKTFVWEGGKAQALKGYNDDLCMASAIGMYVREVSVRFDQYNRDMSKASISNITKVQPYASNKTLIPLKGGYNPWEQQIGDQKHDLTWLL